jgi:hypothetical protein
VDIRDAAEIRRLAAEQATTVSLVLKKLVHQQLARDAVRTAGK